MADGQVILPSGHRWPTEDPKAKGAGVGGEGDLHDVLAGRPGEPDPEEEEEEEVVQKVLPVSRSRSMNIYTDNCLCSCMFVMINRLK